MNPDRYLLKLGAMSLAVLFHLATTAHAASEPIEKISRQFVDYHVRQRSGETAVSRHLEGMRADGTWADVDYADQRRGSWNTLEHLDRIESMAVVYADQNAMLFRSEELKEAILRGLNHWIGHDYQNPNWWHGRIGIPKAMAAAMLLLEEDLPDDLLERAKPILMRSKMGMTGQNKVWCAGNNVMIALLYRDAALLDKAVNEIWSELQVTVKEGIQPDWSFHQHGPQQQFGNYGMSFASDMIMWGTVLRGTEYALNGDKLEILRNYMLHGVSWIIWNGCMDFSGCGRQIDQDAQQKKGRSTIRQLASIPAVDPAFAAEYESVLGRVGFKAFWRSEMGVQRRADWYASVKMSSTRVIGAETCNSENMQGLHLGDGTLLVYLDGSEYENLMPLWNWKRLPGVTCDQGMDDLTPKGRGGSDFSGVMGNETTGVAAMIYHRNDLNAHKAWFFLEDRIVCLGTGITGKTSGTVLTSIQQSWCKGDVQQGGNWAHHADIGYHFLDGKVNVEPAKVDGNWNASFPTRGDRPVSGDVFSIWIDHGKSPENASYAYVVLPQVDAAEMAVLVGDQRIRVLENTAQRQAVATEDALYAVFYDAGKLTLSKGAVVSVDEPCIIQLKGNRLTVCDPRHELENLHVTINRRGINVKLPSGAERGKPVSVDVL